MLLAYSITWPAAMRCSRSPMDRNSTPYTLRRIHADSVLSDLLRQMAGVGFFGPLRYFNEMFIFQAHFSEWRLRYMLWDGPQMNITGHHWRQFNIASGNDLVLLANKTLPELIESPRSGVTLCFQFISAVSTASAVSAASATAKTFASHIKTVWAKA